MDKKSDLQTATSYTLDLHVKSEGVFNDIEMGVLENGVPFLTQTGLAQVCGIRRQTVADISNEYSSCFSGGVFPRGRMEFISSHLSETGFDENKLFIQILDNGVVKNAYPDVVCMALLEFYAFESSSSNDTAKRYYRELSRQGLKTYIYNALKYSPEDPWVHYLDRVSIIKEMRSVPDGYYIVFNEISGMMVDLIHAGLTINSHTVPDISVGLCWAAHWRKQKLSVKYGDFIECKHHYPEAFLQSKSNPQIINSYPNESLAEFRRWFKHEYLPTKFPAYILKRASLLHNNGNDVKKIINAFNDQKQLN